MATTTPTPRPLREVRVSKLMSAQQLARKSGVDFGSISRIERGKVQPRLSTIARLCDALGINPMEVKEFVEVINKESAA